MRINSENIDYKKIVIFLSIIAVIIIFFVVWKPTIKSDIEKYTSLDDKDVDTIASEKYINRYINAISEKDIDYLYNKLSEEYIAYNNLNKEKFISIFDTQIYSNNLSVISVNKYNYNDINIYRAVLGNSNKNCTINIIEENGNVWKWTMGDFYSFSTTNFSTAIENIEITIDSVYQNMDKLELTCYVENNTNNTLDMNLENIDSVMLRLKNGDIINVSNAKVDSSLSVVKPNTMSNRTFSFGIDITNQANVDSIILDNLEINGEKMNTTIGLEF